MKSRHELLRMGAFLLFMGMVFSVFPVSATIFSDDGFDRSADELYELTNGSKPYETNDTPVFFFDPECISCTQAHEFLKTYLVEHPDTEIEIISVSNGTEEKDRFIEFQTAFHREKLFVPALFIGPVGMQGSQTIITNFEDVYRWYHQ
ncbi:MAG TPA: hypothetical protein VN372_09065 [Methanospirillum sp.]|nr:hypothetical protein [Methanospirillum sp.]